MVLTTFWVLVLPPPALASGTISGKVTGEDTSPLGLDRTLVQVFEVGSLGAQYRWWTHTSPLGQYSVPVTDNDSGQYMVRLSKAGYLAKRTGFFPVTGTVNIDRTLDVDPMPTERIWGDDRYSTAVETAREPFTTKDGPMNWFGPHDIVIASGEDHAAADPLAAAGLCAVYNAPLFLVTSDGVPSEVKSAIKEIANTAPHITVHLVGGTTTVPDSIYDEIDQLVELPGGGGIFSKHRIIATGDRYDLAAAIALDMWANKGGATPSRVLIANGEDPEKFFDALALSPISSSMAFPILLVGEDHVPSATTSALNALGNPDLAIGGGPATVSNSVMSQLDAANGTTLRWWGTDRYRTAIDIANNAYAWSYAEKDRVGVAAKLPDALTGGATMGMLDGTIVITDGNTLTPATGSWLEAQKDEIDKCYVIGGPVSITDSVKNEISSRVE
jgi:putative cell wall-binding protein